MPKPTRNIRKPERYFRGNVRLDTSQVVDARRNSRAVTASRVSSNSDPIGDVVRWIAERYTVPRANAEAVRRARLAKFNRPPEPRKRVGEPMKTKKTQGPAPRASARARAVASPNARFNRTGTITTQPVKNPPARVSKPPKVGTWQPRSTVSTRPTRRTSKRLR